MPVKVIVCAKQVLDPEMPPSAFRVDKETKRIVPPPGIPPVVNGFDENAIEAALRIKEAVGGSVTVLSVGSSFAMDVMKKPLSMGADELILVQGSEFGNLDSYGTACSLVGAIKKIGHFDLLLCGRQASDWDNAQVPLGIAEMLGLPCVTLAKKIEVKGASVTVHRALRDGHEVVEAPVPTVITVTNELGEPRYPTLRGIMAATRKTPTMWGLKDIGLDAAALSPRVKVLDLFVPQKVSKVELVKGDNDADSGKKLALKLREAKVI